MRLIILGAGDYGHAAAKLAEQTGNYEEQIFLDNDPENPDAEDLCANFVLYLDDDTEFYPAFESNSLRVTWLNQLMSLGAALAVPVHPDAEIGENVTLLPGTAVFAGAVIRSGSMLKIGCIAGQKARIGKNCVLEPGVQVRPGAEVPDGTHVPQFFNVEE